MKEKENDMPIPKQIRLKAYFTTYLIFAVNCLRLAKTPKVFGWRDPELLNSTTSILYAFMTLESFINYVREYFYSIILSNELRHRKSLLEELGEKLKKYSIEEKWRNYPKMFVEKELDTKTKYFQEFKELIEFRNILIHSKILRFEKDKNGKYLPEVNMNKFQRTGFPFDANEVNFNHGLRALEVTRLMLIEGYKLFKDFIPPLFYKPYDYEPLLPYAAEKGIKAKALSAYIQELKTPISKEDLKIPATIDYKEIKKSKLDFSRWAPPTTSAVVINIIIENWDKENGVGKATFHITGYKDVI